MTLRRRSKQSGELGLTLIEVSVILSVLVILAAFLIPSITQFLNDANSLQAQNDVQAIATGLVNFMKDTGQSPSTALRLTESIQSRAVEVLAGPGEVPDVNRGQVVSLPRGRSALGLRRNLNLAELNTEGWVRSSVGSLEEYLLMNGHGLPPKTNGAAFGWNGPYITSELGSDPWGNQYLVNVVFMGTEAGAEDSGSDERRAVYVVSAGPNQILETPFSQPVSDALVYGDDIAVRIR